MFRPLRSLRGLRRAVALGGGAALVAAGVVAVAAQPALAAATGGSGASLPYVEVQAENSSTNGTVIGPSWAYGQLADEASYRKAVTLQGSGKYVQFTTPVATNSIDFRYSIPDSANGSVYTAPLSLYINGVKQADVTLTNAYSWFYGSYPFTNTPGSNPHHFYDEAHRLLSQTYPAGTTFKLQVDAGDTASSYTIDFADFEQVGPALTQPSGSVSVTSKGADATGAGDSTAAFNAAIAAAGSGGTVWIPPGTYNIPGHITVDNVTIASAGMWYSTVTGAAPGFYGTYPPSTAKSNVHLKDFAIFGNVQERNDNDQVNGIGGQLSNSSASNLWIEHMKVGAWMDGPMDKLTFSGLRIRDTTADGINFHGGVTNSTVTNSDVRNTGDDGIATWADSSVGADAGDTISNNTVQLQILANGIAIYGGHDNTVSGNLVKDSGLTQGGGIHVGQRFTSTPVGTTTISGNTLIRDGSLDPNWQFGVGALWFDGSQGSINGPINVSNALIEQSPYEAVQWVEGTISGVSLDHVTIAGAGTFALQEQTGGAAKFSNVTATGIGASTPVYSCEGGNFTVTDGGGNSGISGTPACGGWPTPVFPPYPSEGVTANPSALSFGSVATGSTSAAQNVTVSNPTGSAAAVSSVAATGDFAQTNTCGSSIPANGSCTVSVTFKPTAAGARTGTLTVNAGGTTSTVSLSGTGTAPGPVLNASPASLSFPGTVVGATAATQTVTVTNSGTTSATVSGATVTGDFGQSTTCSTLAVGASCTVTVTFKPTTGGARTGTLTVNSNANNSPTTVALSGTGIDGSTNVAAGKAASASSSNGAYTAANLTDSDASSYWESAAGAFPQWAQVDLGQSYSVGKVVLKLPPATAWATRQETLSLLGSTDGSSFSTLKSSASYTFDPSTGNTVTLTFTGANARYVRADITANTGWNAAQLSDFEVFPGTGGDNGGGGDNPPPAGNLAAGKSATESSHTQTYAAANVTDGNQDSYWESANNAFPQWVQVDLGAAQSVGEVVLELPASWGARSETLAVTGSTDGSSFGTLKSSASYTFDPNSGGNTVTITFPAASQRYVRVTFTANTGWPAGQLSELQVWGS
ncbi:discoidin domain-containing protein [Actinacidiphila sp. DG2A-62]|uniref:galactose-binding domain-containing protein n=1 Tax=Actinacidiphila sp. DG2A-62 TaxID=3108821 RepID=UPI002DBF46D7|nr:discoidin domain-containing protein [Actinacidiphila sp. DG2A-62]MEC3996613.1 discoidin domain-containing protein [Actinacidiphila sp. DG2A-62]